MNEDERIQFIDKCLRELYESSSRTVPDLVSGNITPPSLNSTLDRKYRFIESEIVRLGVAEITRNGDNTAYEYHYFSITPKGIDLILGDKSIAQLYEEEREQKRRRDLEVEKTEIDLEISKNVLKEYPYTKWFARIGFIIGVILLFKEFYALIYQ
tara:strand:- start:1963 stop:2427 length:465 start_codon:yes stop_codon:yes gene_type:complete